MSNPRSLQRLSGVLSHALTSHFAFAILIGFFFRICAAYFAYGPMAVDDFTHAYLPAFRMATDSGPVVVPPYRSYLLVWFLAGWIKLGQFLGISSGLTLLRWVNGCLGFLSLGVTLGAYRYAREHSKKSWGGIALLYLCAAHFVMPFVGTRSFGEMVSMPFLFLGFGYCEHTLRTRNTRGFAMGLALFGFAVLFRFQNGILYLTYFTCLLLERRRKEVVIAILVGFGLVAAEVGIDLLSHRMPFHTLWTYLNDTVLHPLPHARASLWAYVALLLALIFFPLSISLFRHAKTVFLEHRRAGVCLLVFLLLHSLLTYKEERFILPALPLFFIFVAYLWNEAIAARSTWTRWGFTPVFFIGNSVLLAIACFFNTQAAELAPLESLRGYGGRGVLLEKDGGIAGSTKAQVIFGDEGFRFGNFGDAVFPTRGFVKWVSHRVGTEDWSAVVLTGKGEPLREKLYVIAGVARKELQCDPLEVVSPPIDRWIYRLNPHRNQRRAPSFFLRCTRRLSP